MKRTEFKKVGEYMRSFTERSIRIDSSVLSALLPLLLLPLSACGPMGSGRPTEKYDQLRKSSIPTKPVTQREQTYVGTDTYLIKSETPLEFIAGQKKEVKIRGMLQIPGAKYTLVAHDLPEGATLSPDPSNPTLSIFSWQPSTDFIPRGQREITGEFHVSLSVESLPDPQSQTLIKNLSTETVLNYRVSMAQDRPSIVAVNGLGDEILEGESVSDFTVVVKDVVSDRSTPPTLDVFYTGQTLSAENVRFNGSMFVGLKGAPEHRAETSEWVFHLTFDTSTFGVPEFTNEGLRNKNPRLGVTFYLKATSANGTVSSDTRVDRMIRYNHKVQKPAFSISTKSVEVFQGGEMHLAFSVLLTNGRGHLAIKLKDGISDWPGQPTLTCEDTKDPAVEMQACEFKWKNPCDTKEGDYVMEVFAGADYEGQTSQSVLTKTIKVRKADVCQSPKK